MPNCQGASQQQPATRTPGTSRRRHCIWNAMRNRPASHAKSSTVRDPYSKGDGQTAKKTIHMRAYRHTLGRDRSTRKRAYVHRARTGTDPTTPLGAWQNPSDFRHLARSHGLYLKIYRTFCKHNRQSKLRGVHAGMPKRGLGESTQCIVSVKRCICKLNVDGPG